MSRFYVSKYLDTFREEEDGGNRRNQCEPVGAAGSAARQQHGPMGLSPNVSRRRKPSAEGRCS